MYGLFVDVKRSTQFLMEYQRDFMFSDLNSDNDDDEEDDEDDEDMED